MTASQTPASDDPIGAVHDSSGGRQVIRLAIIIVNYKTALLVKACIASLDVRILRPAIAFHVFVVDNDSRDGSYEALCVDFDGRPDVEVIQSGRNAGYAAGNNLVLRSILESEGYEFVWLLNPDTSVVTDIDLTTFDGFLRPRAGALGARLEDRDTTPQVSAFKFPGFFSEFLQAANLSFLNRWFAGQRTVQPISETLARTDWLAGASVIFKARALRDAGLFDERFFLYFEEVDLFRRLAASGWEAWYDPKFRVIHHVGASTGISEERRRVGEMPDYWYASRSYYFLKQHGMAGALWVDLSWLVGRAVFLVSRLILRRKDTGAVKLGRIVAHNSWTRSWNQSRWVQNG